MHAYARTAIAAALLAAVTAGCTGADPAPPDRAGAAPGSPSASQGDPMNSRLPAEQQAALDRQLIAAAWEDDVPRAERLIAQGADVNAKDDSEQNAYLIATSEGYYELLELTLRHGADVGAKDSFNGTGIIRAAERGHWRTVGRLVQEGVPVDHVNNLGWTGLHEAIILGKDTEAYRDTVRVLVAAGADVTLPSARDGIPPARHADTRGFGTVAELLRAASRVEPGAGDRSAAGRRLLAAAAAGDADAAVFALRAGARLEVSDEQRRTPLLVAATQDRVGVARLLVALGADPDALDARHDTPWLVTGVTGSVAMGEVLLPAHPNLTIRNRFGGVSVIPASERGHVDYVRWVVRDTGIDVNHVNDLGWTALLEAVILGDGSRPYQEIVRILLGAGADPAIADEEGRTALQHAEGRGQTAVAAILRRSR